MKKFDKPLKKFNLVELEKLSFGKLDGERDDRLSDSFFPTKSILQLFEARYSYVLSPKGGGKSAIFRTLKEKLLNLPPQIFDYSKYSIIGINEAFGLDNDYLPTEKFKEEENRKNYTLSWAYYILSELIKDIKNNHKDKNNYSDFFSKLKKIADFKDVFQLYNILDYLSGLNMGVSFNVQGTPIELKPKLSFDTKKEKLVLNEVFRLINDFYEQNEITALILIDRIDNFVRKEAYHIQKNYIQGLIDCIEELTTMNSIAPVLFIRTDLFYSFDIDFEYDKVKERTKELVWEDGETLSFIVYRLLANPYIRDNYREYFFHTFLDNKGQKRNANLPLTLWKKFIALFKKKNSIRIDLKRTITFEAAEQFVRLFFPKSLIQLGNKDFCKWILESLEDANQFVNPRVLIYYLNELLKAQVDFNKRISKPDQMEIEAFNHTDCLHFDIFAQEIFPEVFKKVQNDELRNIYKILKTKEYQAAFKEINERTFSKTKFNSGDINYKKLNMQKEEYERLLKYLCLLGYCREISKTVFEVPELYRYKLTLTSID